MVVHHYNWRNSFVGRIIWVTSDFCWLDRSCEVALCSLELLQILRKTDLFWSRIPDSAIRFLFHERFRFTRVRINASQFVPFSHLHEMDISVADIGSIV